jgi:hypothetical protein
MNNFLYGQKGESTRLSASEAIKRLAWDLTKYVGCGKGRRLRKESAYEDKET